MSTATPPTRASHLGCELAYWTRGNGPAIFFIQGTGLHGNGWLPQIEALSQDHTCLWFDNRGMGLSHPLGGVRITVEQMASDALAVLDAARCQRAHVVGHSLGGCIALQLALAQPERVSSLSLLCTSANGPGLVRFDGEALWRGLRMQIGTLASRRRAFLELVLTGAERQSGDLERIARELEPIFGHDLAVTPPIVLQQVQAMRRWNALGRVAALKDIPTLIVGAAQDRIARPELVRETAGALPGARLIELPDAAHGVTVRAPRVINELLREHIAGVECTRQAGE
ncbi:MAG TPA: alpha/beta hydrolase [Polyangiaceae bacterium]|nr:alpha/beta hydrolase [Polyangiaceae bacterium]